MKALLKSVLFLSLAVLPLAAQPAPGGPMAHRMAKVLGLTEAQKTSIKAIRDRHQPDLALKRDAVKEARKALQAALAVATTPATQIRPLYDAAAAARFDLMMAQRAVQQEVQAILTPEQRIKAAELRGVARERMRQRLHRFGMAG